MQTKSGHADPVAIVKPYRLKRWSLLRRFSRSKGGVREYLTGEVYDDPGHPDGTRIATSAIVSRDDHEAFTSSGTHYLLEGDPEPMDVPESANDLTRAIGGTDLPAGTARVLNRSFARQAAEAR